MTKQLILCEKPSAAKNYALALGGYKGNFNGKEYVIVNSVGHIFQMSPIDLQVEPYNVDKYKKWDINTLPWNRQDIIFHKELNPVFKDTFKKIKDEASVCDEFVIATDNDPTGEGTLLANEIIEALNLTGVTYYRSFHIDESKPEIQKAMKNLKYLGTDPKTDPDYLKSSFRNKWDFLSMQWTRIATLSAGGNAVLREGRLKSFMVKVVGEQIDKANSYKKIPYYQNRFHDENGNIYSYKDEPMYPNKTDVPQVYKQSEVVFDSAVRKFTPPPALYDLNMLSASLASQGFSSKQVLDTYQNMYEDKNSYGEGIVSYPRTEDKKITPEQFNAFLSIADKVADLVGVNKALLTHRRPRTTHVDTACSHGSNRPTGNVPASLEELRKKHGDCGVMIYKFIAHNALAMLAEDYEYEHQTGHVKDYPQFIGSVNIPVNPGYKQVFDDDRQPKTLPLGKIASPYIYEGFPPKPLWPSAKWLATILKKADVGTGATRTSIYSDITDKKSKYPLLVDTKGRITMTDYGKASYILIENTHIGDLKLTESVQKQMRDVAKGADPDVYLDQIENLIKDDIATITQNASGLKAAGLDFSTAGGGGSAKGSGVKCPVCGGDIIFGDKNAYCKNFKQCKFGVYRIICDRKLTNNQLTELISNGETKKYLTYQNKAGKQFKARLILKPDGKTEFEFQKFKA